MADAHIRLQNMALEHAELVARRSMSWSESTNRTNMFMTVVTGAVVGLALFGQTGITGRGMALLAVLILAVVVLIGITTALRIGQLDELDMRWIQGLNRLRALRLELDPGLARYLVTSAHDDFGSVLEEYTTENASPAYAFGTLLAMLLVVNSMLVGVIGGLVPATFLAEGYDAAISVVAGVVATVLFVAAVGLWTYRLTRDFPARLVTVVPARRQAGSAVHSDPTTAVLDDGICPPSERPRRVSTD